jgi:hypothetical protein
MILMTLAAAVLAQWTGPRTVEYTGPGFFCGGGYAVQLAKGERALVLPQSAGAGVQGVRLVLSHGEVNVWSGAISQPGPVVQSYGDIAVTQGSDNGKIVYTIADQTNFGLHVISDAFQGFKRDTWFFRHANFSSDAERGVQCLAAYSF